MVDRDEAVAAPGLAAAARPRSADGTGDQRFRTGAKYSRFVRMMKVMLPLLATALIGLVAAWPSFRDVTSSGKLQDRGQTEVVNARFFGRDRNNRPYSVTSIAAIQDSQQPSVVNLTKPTAEFTQASGSWVTMEALRGRYNQEDGRLVLIDNVHILRDDGLEFSTSVAEADTKAGTAWGNQKVVGQGPTGEIRAGGFRLYDNGNRIEFIKSSTATITGRTADPKK